MSKRGKPRTIGGEARLARRVQFEREQRGWSPAALAARMTKAGCPMSQAAIWKIENGEPRRRITLDEAMAFSIVLGRPLEELLAQWDVAARQTGSKILDDLKPLIDEIGAVALQMDATWTMLAEAIEASGESNDGDAA